MTARWFLMPGFKPENMNGLQRCSVEHESPMSVVIILGRHKLLSCRDHVYYWIIDHGKLTVAHHDDLKPIKAQKR